MIKIKGPPTTTFAHINIQMNFKNSRGCGCATVISKPLQSLYVQSTCKIIAYLNSDYYLKAHFIHGIMAPILKIFIFKKLSFGPWRKNSVSVKLKKKTFILHWLHSILSIKGVISSQWFIWNVIMDSGDIIYLLVLIFSICFGKYINKAPDVDKKQKASTLAGFVIVCVVSGFQLVYPVVLVAVISLFILRLRRWVHNWF